VVAAAVGVAYASAELFGVSFALGAFFAGMMLRESAFSHRAARESLPLREAFSVLFFVSVGMLFDPSILVREPLRVAAVVATIAVGKSLAAFAIVRALRYPLDTALTVSASLAQIGEFSFILAGLGVSLGLLPEEGRSLILAGALISISLNPLLFRAIEPAKRWIGARAGLARSEEEAVDPFAQLPESVDPGELTGHVAIVGYGRVGRRVGAALRARGIPVVVAEQNREIVEQLREQGVHAVCGDGSQPNVLAQAHIARACALVIATPDPALVRRMIEIARSLQPEVAIAVRTHSEDEARLLETERLGAVFLGDHELAQSMTRFVLERVAAERNAAAHG
jgi:CPA2 family monovalent cation:H+ antiporter-2